MPYIRSLLPSPGYCPCGSDHCLLWERYQKRLEDEELQRQRSMGLILFRELPARETRSEPGLE